MSKVFLAGSRCVYWVELQRFSNLTHHLCWPGDNAFAAIFASDEQLRLLSDCEQLYMDATFAVVPRLYYQLFTLFVNVSGYTFPAVFVLMTHKTTELYTAVFSKVRDLAPHFAPLRVMADFESASVKGLQAVFGTSVIVSGCWFHYSQAVARRAKKIGLAEPYRNSDTVRKCIRLLMCLPLLPSTDMMEGLEDIRTQCVSTVEAAVQPAVSTLAVYVDKQWMSKRTIGPQRLSVVGHMDRSNNGVESFHSALRRRIQVAHPNLFTFIKHLQAVSIDTVSDTTRLRNGRQIRRPKKKTYQSNDKHIRQCTERYAAGTLTRFEFLCAVGHVAERLPEAQLDDVDGSDEDHSDEDEEDEVDAPSPPAPRLQAPTTPATCEVCMIMPRDDVALIPCGHRRFCRSCIDELVRLNLHCPLCRATIAQVIQLY